MGLSLNDLPALVDTPVSLSAPFQSKLISISKICKTSFALGFSHAIWALGGRYCTVISQVVQTAHHGKEQEHYLSSSANKETSKLGATMAYFHEHDVMSLTR